MLIEFSVSNFRSFRDKQTFSMVAAPRLQKRDNVFKPNVKGEKLPDLLKVAAIYGPNASGKSNLIETFDVIRSIAIGANTQFESLPVTPFRFDPQLADQPTRIEVHFIVDEQRYQFDLALTSARIVEERLLVFPKGKEMLLYERRHLDSGDHYTFGKHLEGGSDLHELWRKVTGPQALFLVQAVTNSNEVFTQLRTPLKWLRGGFMTIVGNMEAWGVSSQEIAKENPFFAKELSQFLQDIDVPITSIRFDDLDSDSKIPQSNTIFTYRTALGEADFSFEEQSEGTKNLIGFWLPWIAHSSSAEENHILIVDELDSSLHPEIVVSLIAKHIKSDVPRQLIFTTHDTHLMDTKLLRRDQFWLTERDANGATQLRSIHDFEGRESEDLEKRYYEGRYRGLPFIRRK
jgi:hypothetical protein